jgi:hypothetical protein
MKAAAFARTTLSFSERYCKIFLVCRQPFRQVSYQPGSPLPPAFEYILARHLHSYQPSIHNILLLKSAALQNSSFVPEKFGRLDSGFHRLTQCFLAVVL